MFSGSGIIKLAMAKRGYKHRRTEDQFSISGEYASNLQFVYSKEKTTKAGQIVDLVYFAADILNEELIIGMYRENPKAGNGVLINASRSLGLRKFNAKDLDRVLNQLVTPPKDKLN